MATKNQINYITYEPPPYVQNQEMLREKIINITKEEMNSTVEWINNNFKDDKLIDFAREVVSIERTPFFKTDLVMELCTVFGMNYNLQFYQLFLDFICPRILREFLNNGFLTLQQIISSRMFTNESAHFFADYLPKEYFIKIPDSQSTKEILTIIDQKKMDIYHELLKYGCTKDSVQYWVKYDEIDKIKEAFEKGSITIDTNINITSFDFSWNVVNRSKRSYDKILDYAAFYGSKQCINFLLEKGAKITQTTLECAFYSEDYELVLDLYNKNREEIKVQELFSTACTIHNKDIIQWVLESRPSLGSSFKENGYGCISIESCNDRLTHYLINCVKVFEPPAWYELFKSAGYSNSISFLDYCIISTLGIDLKMSCANDRSIECELMHNASSCSNRQMIKFLKKCNVDINIKGSEGVTPLITAATDADTETCLLLLKYGADVNAVDNNKYTALWSAVDRMDENMVTLLLEHKADPNIIPNESISPLHLAASHNCYNIVKKLIEAGAIVNTQDNSGKTPLYDATGNGFYDICKLLIESKADVNIRDSKSTTPYEYAMKLHALKVAQLLIENGAHTRQNYEGQTFMLPYNSRFRAEVGSSGSEWSDSDDQYLNDD